MNLASGSRVGPYEITGRVGAGGMGEVWRGRDTRIGRDVAIKVLPDEVAADPDRLRRFEQEARAAGTLNHPNLVTIYDVGTNDGVPYLVMELLEGETLRAKLGDTASAASVRIPIRKAMDYAQQLANGLAAAHRKGIVHRDLKPDNIFITTEGHLKVLDFGLAKVAEAAFESGEDPAAEATKARNTSPGMIIGTVGYMAPEQVRGQETDHRTDIFATGAILYEMVSGHRAFRGGSAADTMSAILNQDPADIDSGSGQHVSPVVDRVIRRCLEKEKTQRFESARDLAFALEAVTSSGVSHEHVNDHVASEQPPRPRAIVPVIALAALLLAGIVAAVLAYRMGRAAAKPARHTFTQLTFDAAVETAPSISPDGKTLAFVKRVEGGSQLLLQRVDGRSAIVLSRSPEHQDRSPAFSPDGSQIAFRSSRDGGGIFVMGATGESVRRITSGGFDPSWSPDGKEIVYSSEELEQPNSRNSVSTLSVVNVETGAVRVLTRLDGMQPQFSPHGKRVLFWALPPTGGQRDLYSIAVSGDPKSRVALTSDAALDWNPVWAPDGKSVLFASDRGGSMNLWRIGIDEESGLARGKPQPLSVPATWVGHISMSRSGQVLYTARTRSNSLRRGTFDPVTERLTIDPRPFLSGSLLVRNWEASPDGQWVAFTPNTRQEDVYLIRSDGSELRQLTNDVGRDRGVTWDAGGSQILFYSSRGGDYDAWTIRPDGSGLSQVTKDQHVNFPLPSPDGKQLYFCDLEHGRLAKLDGRVVTQAEKIPPVPGLNEAFFAVGWSPDGTRLVGTGWLTRDRLFVYSPAERRYVPLEGHPDADNASAKWIDDQRILFVTQRNQLVVLDLVKGTSRVVAEGVNGTISGNARTVILVERHTDDDIWQLTLDASGSEEP